MGNRICITEFGHLAMVLHAGSNYRIITIDLHRNCASFALMPDTVDKDGLPDYAPTFDSYNDAQEWLEENYQKLF